MKPPQTEYCELCNREIELSFHHLVPKKMHNKRRVKKEFKEIDLDHHGIWVCNDCHKHIHKFFKHKRLAYELNSKEKLLSNKKMIKFVKWVAKQDKRVKRG